MEFEFATTARIVFGPGSFAQVGKLAGPLGSQALAATHFSPGDPVLEQLRDLLKATGLTLEVFQLSGEPTVSSVSSGAKFARRKGSDLVIGLGGGSAIDSAKAIAALANNPGEPLDYIEVIGAGKPLRVPPLPVLAIPTTAGTGSEVTRNAVISSKEHHVKASLRSPLILPKVALVDPELTYSLPRQITSWTGSDALTQLIEPFVSNAANPLTDALCRDGIKRISRSLRTACDYPDDAASREDMSLASLFGGLALANARLGAVHGFAGVIGGMYEAPHGAICARLLPIVMEANIRALRERSSNHPALERYARIARLLTGKKAAPEAGVDLLVQWMTDFQIPGLGSYGLERDKFASVVENTHRASSTKGNPIVLSDEELWQILEKAI